jgi:hypothetical protein
MWRVKFLRSISESTPRTKFGLKRGLTHTGATRHIFITLLRVMCSSLDKITPPIQYHSQVLPRALITCHRGSIHFFGKTFSQTPNLLMRVVIKAWYTTIFKVDFHLTLRVTNSFSRTIIMMHSSWSHKRSINEWARLICGRHHIAKLDYLGLMSVEYF